MKDQHATHITTYYTKLLERQADLADLIEILTEVGNDYPWFEQEYSPSIRLQEEIKTILDKLLEEEKEIQRKLEV